MLARIRKVMDTNDSGASAVEYGLLVAAIAAVIVVVVFALGGYIQGAFDTTCQAIETGGTVSANPASTCP